jgi:hypothetical protein
MERVGDINAKKQPMAEWKLVTRPKSKGSLGVIKLRVQNGVLLMRRLHKFYSKEGLPWVKLIWERYYRNGKVPGQVMKGPFWWRSLLMLLNTFKGIAQVRLGAWCTILLWSDMWKLHSSNFLPSAILIHKR